MCSQGSPGTTFILSLSLLLKIHRGSYNRFHGFNVEQKVIYIYIFLSLNVINAAILIGLIYFMFFSPPQFILISGVNRKEGGVVG